MKTAAVPFRPAPDATTARSRVITQVLRLEDMLVLEDGAVSDRAWGSDGRILKNPFTVGSVRWLEYNLAHDTLVTVAECFRSKTDPAKVEWVFHRAAEGVDTSAEQLAARRSRPQMMSAAATLIESRSRLARAPNAGEMLSHAGSSLLRAVGAQLLASGRVPARYAWSFASSEPQMRSSGGPLEPMYHFAAGWANLKQVRNHLVFGTTTGVYWSAAGANIDAGWSY